MNRKETLLISIAIFFTIIMWLVADIYHASTTEKVKPQTDISQPINIELDTSVFQILENKKS